MCVCTCLFVCTCLSVCACVYLCVQVWIVSDCNASPFEVLIYFSLSEIISHSHQSDLMEAF